MSFIKKSIFGTFRDPCFDLQSISPTELVSSKNCFFFGQVSPITNKCQGLHANKTILPEKPITEIARFLQTLRDCPCNLMKHELNIKVQKVVWEREGHSCPSMDNPKILPTAGFFGNKRINGITRLCRQEKSNSTLRIVVSFCLLQDVRSTFYLYLLLL